MKPHIKSFNPITGELLGTVDNLDSTALDQLIVAAHNACAAWKNLSFKERARYLLNLREELASHIDELALFVSQETGKPRFEALTAEVFPLIQLISWAVKRAPKILKTKKISISVLKYKKSYVHYEPMGVIGIITPWNYPLAIPLGEAVMAMVAGNCVIVKPSEVTPLIAKKVEEIFKKIGLPDGVFQVATGDGETGAYLVQSPYIKKIFFTGSVATGKRIACMAAELLKPCVLELGGCDPMIVCEDADIERAANGAVWGSFMNAGQTCASVERVYVHHKVADSFIDHVIQKTQKLRVGQDKNFDVDVGAVTFKKQFGVYKQQLTDALNKNAKILVGDMPRDEVFAKPTVLVGTNDDMTLIQEETFGPYLPIEVVYDDEEAIKKANHNQYGLCASVWTKNMKKALALASSIEAGTVTINDCSFTHALPETPWGGVKNSGLGRVHGDHSFYEFVNMKHVNCDRGWIKPLWWYPYTQFKYNLFKKLAVFLGRKSIFEKIKSFYSK